MRNEYTLSLDIKKRMSHITPIFLQHDSATLFVKPFDKGMPFNMTPVERIEVAHHRQDGKVIVGFGKKHTFNDGTIGIKYDYLGSEMNYAGDVQTTISMFTKDSEEKVSMLPIVVKIVTDDRDYAVADVGSFTEIMKEATKLLGDLSVALNDANSTTAEMKKIIINANDRIKRMDEQLALIGTAISKADKATSEAIEATKNSIAQTQKALEATIKAEEATTEAIEATQATKKATSEAIEATLKSLEQTQKSLEATEKTEQVKDATEAVRIATESERLNTASVREETIKVKEDTTKVKEDTLLVKEETLVLKGQMETLKAETETVKGQTEVATEESKEATKTSIEVTKESKEATENSILTTEESLLVSAETKKVKDATEDVRVATEATRESTELVKTETEDIRDKTKILYGEVNTLKDETEIAKNDTLEATKKANDASDLIDKKVQDYDEHIYDYEYLLQYDSGKTYKKHNQVYFNRNSYIAIQDVPVGESPPPNTTELNNKYWNLFAIGGIDGKGAVNTVNGVSPDPSTFDVDLRVAKQMKITEPLPAELGSKNIAISDTAPPNPKEGDFWVSFDDDKV